MMEILKKLFFACLVTICAVSMARGGTMQPAKDGFILLKGGEFTMGSPQGERQREPDEAQHKVNLRPFYMDPREVSQKDYEMLMGNNPSRHRGENLPVENLTWLDAIRYCNAKSQKEGLTPVYEINGEAVAWNRAANGYRLPTEAEWEYAARAGTDAPFYTGRQITSKNANFEGSYPYLIEENYVTQRDPDVRTSQNRGETISVDSLPPNPFGLHNMLGNVSEWVFDYYGPYADNADNPAGPVQGMNRVNRGGGFNDFGKHLRSAYRSSVNPRDADPNTGFRLARNAEAGSGTVATNAPERINMAAAPRTLVAFYSYSGNTRKGAKMLVDKLGADLYEIKMRHPYRGNIYETSQKDLNAGTRPELVEPLPDMDKYDVILLGYPTWWATMPMPIVSFLEKENMAGKIILPFSSHGGTIFGDSVSDLGKTAKGAYVMPGFEYHYSGGSNLGSRMDGWLKESGLQ